MKRVLIIAYYWPPAGGPGVQRWLKFVTYFKEFGIEPIVYVPENPHYPLVDEAMTSEVPDGTIVIKHPIKEPYRLAKLFSKKKTSQFSSGVIPSTKKSIVENMMLYVRGNFFIPDARVGWVNPSVIFLKKYIFEEKIDTIITTGPPHSLHLIGMKLKESLNISWLADFRDPWTTIHYHDSLRLTEASKRKHKVQEAKVLQAADHIITTSARTKLEFQEITKQPITVITNGFEPQNGMNPVLDVSFSIAHIGSLLSDRNPKVLWDVLSELASEDENFRNDLEIKLAGATSDVVFESLETLGLSDVISNLGYVSHKEALQLQHNAQLLLVVEIDTPETRAIIPGKVFEYLAARRPIIAIGPMGSDIQAILKETESGVYFNPSEKEALKQQLLQYYNAFKKNSLQVASVGIEKFSRRELTKTMSSVLKSIS